MPRGDGSGPQGAGAMTGRGAGYCAGNNVSGFQNGGTGFGKRGCRRGFGSGNGAMNGLVICGQRGNRFQFKQTGLAGWQRAGMTSNPTVDADSQESLRKRAEALQAELGRINALLEKPESE